MAFRTSKLGRLKAYVERWGWLRTAYRIVMKIAGDYLGIHVFLVRGRRADPEVGNPMKLPEIGLRKLDAKTLGKFTEDSRLELHRDFVESALQRGDLAYGAFDESELVAYTWRTTSTAPHTDRIWVRVKSPYNYSYKSFTRRDYRGNRILPALILYSDQDMLEAGSTHRVGFVATTNFPSVAMGKHHGTRKIGYAWYLDWFNKLFAYRSRAVAATGFEFYGRDPGKTV